MRRRSPRHVTADQERLDRDGHGSLRRRRPGRGREDYGDRVGADDAGGPRDRRRGQVRAAGRHRRAHPHGHAVRRHHLRGRLRVGHHRRRLRRHHDHRGLRHPVQGPGAGRGARRVDEEGRGQGRHRLRLPHDHHGPLGPGRGRDGHDGARGRHVLQALHGLPRRLHDGRREHLPRAAAHGEERRHHLHARRERRRDRRAGEEGARRGEDRAQVPRHHASRAGGGRGHASRHRPRRNGRRADLHRPPLGGRGAGDGDRGARPRPPRVRGDVPAVPVPLGGQLRRAGLRAARST